MPSDLYGSQLASIHHTHFGDLARGAAAELLALLGERHVTSGTIVEFACGGGLSTRIVADAGYDVLGVDVSAAMIELARSHLPGARFECASLWDFELPEAIAVTAVGEAFCYQSAGHVPDLGKLGVRLQSIADALPSGGLLLFDVATPGRSGRGGRRHASWEASGTYLYLDERELPDSSSLTRTIDSFVPVGELYKREREVHRLTLYEPAPIERMLEAAGFAATRMTRFGDFELRPGWLGWLAVKS